LTWRYRKLGNLTSNHTKFNVWKNDCTCARNIQSCYLLYVNEIAQNGCFVVKRYTVRVAKTWRYAVHKAEIGRHAVRKRVLPSWKWIVVHVLSLSGLGFQIKYIVTKVRKTTNFCWFPGSTFLRGNAWKKKHLSYRPTQTKHIGSVKGKQSIF